MKTTERKSIAPADAGLSIVVCSGPRGTVRDNDWPCIEYTLQLMHRHKPIWTGEYRLGVGHVKWPTTEQVSRLFVAKAGLTTHEENVCRIHARGQTVKKTPEGMQAEAWAAAKLAKVQKVIPKLDDVCHSLLMDGSAFFDGQRFEEWADDLGYSSDSIKAKETFETCDRIGRDISKALSRDELEGLREWASNY